VTVELFFTVPVVPDIIFSRLEKNIFWNPKIKISLDGTNEVLMACMALQNKKNKTCYVLRDAVVFFLLVSFVRVA
jgi:hypothetical protein